MSRTELQLHIRDYDLAATLNSGQAFRWHARGGGWEGVVGPHWVRLSQTRDGINATTARAVTDWGWLRDYLQTEVNMEAVLRGFPNDRAMRAAVHACRGLRLLRQGAWECLVSFICSATKQIVQIRHVLALLCERYGHPVTVPPGHPTAFAFPTPERLAQCSEAELRAVRMGFRAPRVRAAAIEAASGRLRLGALASLPLASARERLLQLPGVGPKIADCVLLFSGAHPAAFPLDVWIRRALTRFYFPHRRVSDKRLRGFAASHFGPCAGYAQQYLFHYIRFHCR